MEESISLFDKIRQTFSCEEQDIRTYSPLTLAFMGDCVFEIIIRTVLLERGNRQVNSLHKTKSKIVNASVQAKMAEALYDVFTEEELAVYKRGRNAKSHTMAKNASVNDYRKSTGLEAVYGFLYLTGQEDRLMELTKLGLQKVDITI